MRIDDRQFGFEDRFGVAVEPARIKRTGEAAGVLRHWWLPYRVSGAPGNLPAFGACIKATFITEVAEDSEDAELSFNDPDFWTQPRRCFWTGQATRGCGSVRRASASDVPHRSGAIGPGNQRDARRSAGWTDRAGSQCRRGNGNLRPSDRETAPDWHWRRHRPKRGSGWDCADRNPRARTRPAHGRQYQATVMSPEWKTICPAQADHRAIWRGTRPVLRRVQRRRCPPTHPERRAHRSCC